MLSTTSVLAWLGTTTIPGQTPPTPAEYRESYETWTFRDDCCRSPMGSDSRALPYPGRAEFDQPDRVTGYNVYRATNPALPPASWTLVGSDVVDEDARTPNKQWVDRTGDTPPVGQSFYYQVTAYNHLCGAEGPR